MLKKSIWRKKTVDKTTIIMGRYPQNCGLEKEPVEWIVLKKEINRCLCASKYLLDCKPYHKVPEKITWENCSLRRWLNNTFLFTVFLPEEQEKILLSNIKNPRKDTLDYIFLLNYDEAEEYFLFEERATLTTSYTRSQGAWFVHDNDEDMNKGCWWLRYFGEECEKQEGVYDFISCVNFDGYIEEAAQGVEATNCCVRPAFWLKID